MMTCGQNGEQGFCETGIQRIGGYQLASMLIILHRAVLTLTTRSRYGRFGAHCQTTNEEYDAARVPECRLAR